jgi:hypothetical protein
VTDQPTTPDTCCVCDGGPVVYRNYQEQPFCAHCANCACGTVSCTRPAPDSLREQYAAAIRPNMLMGLQDAELDGPGGTQRINEWVDWIAKELAEVRDGELEQLRADLARVQQRACGTAEALRLNSQRLDAVLADRESERAARTAEEKRARTAEAARDQARAENVDARAAIERLKLLVAASSEPGHAVRMAAQYAERAIENGKRAEQAEAALKTLAPMFEGLGRLIATSSRDWSEYRVDAWLWAVLVGWDCEEAHTHDETCEGGSLEEIAAVHGWSEEAIAKARCYRAAVEAAAAGR